MKRHRRNLSAGLLFRCDTDPGTTSVYVLCTGVASTPERIRVRILGIPVYTRNRQ